MVATAAGVVAGAVVTGVVTAGVVVAEALLSWSDDPPQAARATRPRATAAVSRRLVSEAMEDRCTSPCNTEVCILLFIYGSLPQHV